MLRSPSRLLVALGACALVHPAAVLATNPLIMDQFTADPTARVFEGKVYVYPSHDIPPVPGKTRPDWFCMEDYHVFSSNNLTDWQDHGVIVKQTDVPWADATKYALWAPDCVEKQGRYYFYFPALPKTGGGFRIGVATADKPYGPFKPEPQPIEGVNGIDPCVFFDTDGSAYLFYSQRKIFVAKLKPGLLELESAPQTIENLPVKGLLEGSFVFARNGIYYLTYPHVEHRTERLEYATATHPLGPYKPAGVILDESASGCWTVHHSIVEYQGQWYLFYHDNDLSPRFDKNRSIRADRLFFNADGTIRKVVPTLRGVGVADARREIQIDRYSATSGAGVSVAFLSAAEPREGWKVSLAAKDDWVRFNEVDFGRRGLKRVKARAVAEKGAVLELRVDAVDGPVVGRVQISGGAGWEVFSGDATALPTGVHDLVVTQTGGGQVDVDWVSFE